MARGAELLARMAVSAPMVIRDGQNSSGALDLVAKCLQESNTEALHQALRMVFISYFREQNRFSLFDYKNESLKVRLTQLYLKWKTKIMYRRHKN